MIDNVLKVLAIILVPLYYNSDKVAPLNNIIICGIILYCKQIWHYLITLVYVALIYNFVKCFNCNFKVLHYNFKKYIYHMALLCNIFYVALLHNVI